MDQELGFGMGGAAAVDVCGANARVDVAFAVPDVESRVALRVVR
jgi:hypothetical protein